jgi:hypothetical protein
MHDFLQARDSGRSRRTTQRPKRVWLDEQTRAFVISPLVTTAHGFWYGVDAGMQYAGMQYADQSTVLSARV